MAMDSEKVARKVYRKLKNERAKVRVWVRASVSIPYVVEVEDVNDPEEIRRKLLEKDPADWESDPCFYEALGGNWKDIVRTMTDEEIEQNTEHLIGGDGDESR